MDDMPGRSQTQAIASSAGSAPDAKTDIAIVLNRPSSSTRSYAAMPPHIRNPALLMFAQTIASSMPSSVSKRIGRTIWRLLRRMGVMSGGSQR